MKTTLLTIAIVMGLACPTVHAADAPPPTDEATRAPDLAELTKLAEQARAELAPISDEEIGRAKKNLLASFARLETFLSQTGATAEKDWKSYLRWHERQSWDKLEQTLREDAQPDMAVLAGVLDGLVANHPGLEAPAFVEFGQAIRTYQYVTGAASEKGRRYLETELEQLPQKLADYSQQPTAEDRVAIGRIVGTLATVDRAGALVRSTRHAFSKPNIVVKVRTRDADTGLRLAVDQASPEGRLAGWLSLVVSIGQRGGDLTFLFRGWEATRSEVRLDRAVVARKLVQLGPDGIQMQPTAVAAAGRTQDQMAWMRDLIDRQVHTLLDPADRAYRERLCWPVVKRGGFPQLDIAAEGDRICVSSCYADPFQLSGAPTAPPSLADHTGAVVHVHESAIENFCHPFLAGVRITDEMIAELFAGLIGEVPENLRISEDSEPVALTLSYVQPLSVRLKDGRLGLRLRTRRFMRGPSVFADPLLIEVVYRVETRGERVQFVREGDVRVQFVNKDRPSVGESVGRRVVQSMIQSRLVPAFFELPLSRLNLAGLGELPGQFQASRIRLEDGWLSVGWAEPHRDDIRIGRLYQESDPDAIFAALSRDSDRPTSELVAEYDQLTSRTDHLLASGNQEALAQWEQAVAIERELGRRVGSDPPELSAARWLANRDFDYHQGDAALADLVTLAETHARRYGADSPQAAIARNYLAEGRLREQADLRSRLAESDALSGTARQLRRQGRTRQGIRLTERVRDIRRELLGEAHPGYALTLYQLGQLYQDSGRQADADRAAAEAVSVHRRVSHPDDAGVVSTLGLLAEMCFLLGKYEEEARVRHDILASIERRFAADGPRKADARCRLATAETLAAKSPQELAALAEARGSQAKLKALASVGKRDEALALAETIAATYRTVLGEEHVDYADLLLVTGELHHVAGRRELAESEYRQAAQILEKHLGQEHPRVAAALEGLARLYEHADSHAEAAAVQRRVVAIYRHLYGEKTWQYRGARAALFRSELIDSLPPPKRRQLTAAIASESDFHAQLFKQNPAQARTLAETLVRTYRDLGCEAGVDYARGLMLLSDAYRHTGHFAEATEHLEAACGVLESELGSDHPQHGDALMRLAVLNQLDGRFARGRQLADRASRVIGDAVGIDHPHYARILVARGDLCSDLGDFPAAEEGYREAAYIYRLALGETHADYGQVLGKLADLLLVRGDYAEADGVCRRVADFAQRVWGSQSARYARALIRRARLSQEVGNYHEAEQMYRQCLSLPISRLDRASATTQLSSLYAQRGEYEKAEQLCRDALKRYEQDGNINDRGYARALGRLGEVLTFRGQAEEAMRCYDRATDVFEPSQRESDSDYARCLLSMGQLHTQQKSWDLAEQRFKQAAGVYQSLDPLHPEYAQCLDELARVYAQRGLWDEAAESEDAARRVMRRHVADVLPVLSEQEQLVFLKTRDESSLHRSLSFGLAKSLPSGLFGLGRKRDPKLIRMSAAWVINGKGVAQEALAVRAILAREQEDPEVADLARQLKATRAQLAKLTLRSQIERQEARGAEQIAKLARQERKLAKQLGRLRGSDLRDDPWIELKEVQAAVPTGAVVVELSRFRVSEPHAADDENSPLHYVAWLIPWTVRWIPRSGVVQLVDLGPADEIDAAVAELHSTIGRPSYRGLVLIDEQSQPAGGAAIDNALEKISNLVLRRLEPILSRYERWLICPDGTLWLVPWSAMLLNDGKHALERHKISFLVTGRDLVRTRTGVSNRPSLVLADPDFDHAPTADPEIVPLLPQSDTLRSHFGTFVASWRHLPGTAQEAETVIPKLESYAHGTKARVHLGREAAEAMVKSADRPRVLILSTHGYFISGTDRGERAAPSSLRATTPLRNPLLRCGLVMAGANRRAPSELDADDGILTGLEIVGTDLRGTELVVLSACETAVGDIHDGEGVAGLRQAFHLAGAHTVIATLWKIPDRETVDLMSRFWDFMIPPKGYLTGHNKSDALRLAQIKMLARMRGGKQTVHPLFWAAFTLTGQTAFPEPKPEPRRS